MENMNTYVRVLRVNFFKFIFLMRTESFSYIVVYPTDPSNLKCLIPKAHFFTLHIIAEHIEHIHFGN